MEDLKELAKLDAPYGKNIALTQVSYDNGFAMLRMRIKEGKRFTDMDLDVNTVKTLNEIFTQWLQQQAE